jgi:arylsulfatase
LLNDAGYHTYASGKWDPGRVPGRLPVDHGFEQSFVLAAGGASHFADMAGTFRPNGAANYYENDKKVEKLPEDFYSSEFYADRIIDYIDSNDDERPFLAYLSFTVGHWPLQVPDDWLDRYANDYEEGWHEIRQSRFNRQLDMGIIPAHAQLSDGHPSVQDWDKLLPAQRQVELKRMRVYAAMIENMDHHIGRVLQALQERDSDRETVIIFISMPSTRFWITATGSRRTSTIDSKISEDRVHICGWASAGPTQVLLRSHCSNPIRQPADCARRPSSTVRVIGSAAV